MKPRNTASSRTDDLLLPVVDLDRYRVDGVISGECVPIGDPPYEHEMQYFKVKTWQVVLTADVEPCPCMPCLAFAYNAPLVH